MADTVPYNPRSRSRLANESDSIGIITNATDEQKRKWDETIKDFLIQLVKLEQPYRYKYIGRNSNQKLQFSRYISEEDFGLYVSNLFGEIYYCSNLIR